MIKQEYLRRAQDASHNAAEAANAAMDLLECADAVDPTGELKRVALDAWIMACKAHGAIGLVMGELATENETSEKGAKNG